MLEKQILLTRRADMHHSFVTMLCAAYNELQVWDDAVEACEKSLLLQPGFVLVQND